MFSHVICDLDGTLLDSDAALAGAFIALGVPSEQITFGHVVADECERLGLSLSAYLDAYDETAAQPFPGVEEVIRQLTKSSENESSATRFSICSNKHPRSGFAELARLQWRPAMVAFADSFSGPKTPKPILEQLQLPLDQVLFLGDTEHDRQCAQQAGIAFALAAWNQRASAQADDIVLTTPQQLLTYLQL